MSFNIKEFLFQKNRISKKTGRLPSVKTLGTLDKNLGYSWISW